MSSLLEKLFQEFQKNGIPGIQRILLQKASQNVRPPTGSASGSTGGSNRAKLGLGASIIPLALLGYSLNNSIYNVDGGFRAVKYSRFSGVKDEIYNEGTHLLLPWFETPITFDVRARPRNVTSLSGTKG